jgi:hypothetical protein
VAAAIAIRASARVLPLLAHELRLADDQIERNISAKGHVLPAILYLSRAYFSEQASIRVSPYSHYRFGLPYGSDGANATFRILWSAQAAADASSYTNRAFSASVKSASFAIERSVSAARSLKRTLASDAMLQIAADVEFLEQSNFDISTLLRSELWFSSEARVLFLKFWSELRGYLLDLDNNWSIWVDWYDAKFRGYTAFEVNNDVYNDIMMSVCSISESEWANGPTSLNALAIECVLQAGGIITSIDSSILDEDFYHIPAQGPGPHFELSADYIIDKISYNSGSDNNYVRDRIELLRPLVLQAAKNLLSSLSINEFPELSNAVLKYISILESDDLEDISWGEIWGLGVIIRNAADAADREITARILPALEDPSKAALESLLTLHGPMVLATDEGQALTSQAQIFSQTRDQRELLRSAADSIAGAISRRADIATKNAADAVSDAASAMIEGTHPERGAVYGLSSVRNVMIPLAAAAVVTSPSAIGYLLMGPNGALAAAPISFVAVEGLKKSSQFMALMSALGTKFDSAFDRDPMAWMQQNARRFAPFRSFFLQNKDSLLQIASQTPEFRWIKQYIKLIEVDE